MQNRQTNKKGQGEVKMHEFMTGISESGKSRRLPTWRHESCSVLYYCGIQQANEV